MYLFFYPSCTCTIKRHKMSVLFAKRLEVLEVSWQGAHRKTSRKAVSEFCFCAVFQRSGEKNIKQMFFETKIKRLLRKENRTHIARQRPRGEKESFHRKANRNQNKRLHTTRCPDSHPLENTLIRKSPHSSP